LDTCRDFRGNYHSIHHWQNGDHNKYYNGGHSFSRDGVTWTFSNTPAYSKNITWTTPFEKGAWTLMDRRERPGLLLDGENWSTPLVLFTSVVHQGESWLVSQPIRQSAAPAGSAGGASCQDDEGCNLNGKCVEPNKKCVCDPQWDGSDCGVLALLPANPNAGYHRKGFNAWGGNPFYAPEDKKYHVFAVEMTHGCPIDNYLTNSQVRPSFIAISVFVGIFTSANIRRFFWFSHPSASQIIHAESTSPAGPYTLAPIQGSNAFSGEERAGYHAAAVGGPAPASAVLMRAFAHAPRSWRDPSTGALVVVYEGRNSTIPDSKQHRC
jgi:hypothetical protein